MNHLLPLAAWQPVRVASSGTTVGATAAVARGTAEMEGSTGRLSRLCRPFVVAHVRWTEAAGWAGGDYSGSYSFNVTANADSASGEHAEWDNGQLTDRTWGSPQTFDSSYGMTFGAGCRVPLAACPNPVRHEICAL